jgi:selenium metabolism protein YedF
MEKKIIDCRGLSCPQPVVETKKIIDEFQGDEIDVLLDDETAFENVSRFASTRNWIARNMAREEGWVRLSLKRQKVETCPVLAQAQVKTILLYCSSDMIGRGDDELGRLLMRNFIKSLLETPPLPDRMVFVNAGVKLVTEGSPVLDTLKEFENRGVEIAACGTCLDYFSLKDKLKVGKVTNMFDIISALQTFDKVVHP